MHSLEQCSVDEPIIQTPAPGPWRGTFRAIDRQAAEEIGEILTEYVWNFRGGKAFALDAAAEVRRAGSGFGPALAEWLERWARDEGRPE